MVVGFLISYYWIFTYESSNLTITEAEDVLVMAVPLAPYNTYCIFPPPLSSDLCILQKKAVQ